MTRMDKIGIVLVALAAMIASSAIVAAVPPIPESYWGYASLDDAPALTGTLVTVEVYGTGEEVGRTTVQYAGGGYSLDIVFDDPDTAGEDEGATEGDNLTWKLNGIGGSVPAPGEDTATSGNTNANFNISAFSILSISNVTAADITTNSATITWDTDEVSDSLVKYGTESGNYTMSQYNATDVIFHTVKLTGLNASTVYYYVVNSTDESDNANESVEYNFVTLSSSDTTPPTITSFAPPSPVNETVCNWRTFNVTVNQTADVSWYLNDSPLFTNVSTREANCTLHAEAAGEHNVSAIATNANGTTMQTWVWNVTQAFGNTLTIPDLTVLPGDNNTTAITLNNATGVASISIKLCYNKSVVNVTNASISDFTSFFGFDNTNAANGWITINTYIAGHDLTGDVTVANVTLQAVGNLGDTSLLNLSILTLSDQYGTDVTGSTDNGTFTIPPDTGPPAVTNASSSHEIPDDTDNDPRWGETATLNVTVTDDLGVANVTINLSTIGGSSAQSMTLTNATGNNWSVTTNASAGTPPQTYLLPVTATDIYGKSNTSVSIPLTVMRNGDTTGNSVRDIADAMLLANNVSYPYHVPAYVISSPFVVDVTGNGVVNIADAMLIANNVSFPYHEPAYVLR